MQRTMLLQKFEKPFIVYNTPIKKNLCLYMTNNCANRPFYPGPLLQFISRMLRVCLVNETIFFHLYTFHMHCWKDNIYLAHCWLTNITLFEPSTFTSTPLISLSPLINAFIFSLIQIPSKSSNVWSSLNFLLF